MDLGKIHIIRLISAFDAISRDMSDEEIIAGTSMFLACIVQRSGMSIAEADVVVAEAHKVVRESLESTKARDLSRLDEEQFS